ncbi:hypothetical protein NFI95_05770, partial [Acetobacteraceae bacterium KSS8]|nr:hypothetical protein [Acetobacteraceae bacterium KSS8]
QLLELFLPYLLNVHHDLLASSSPSAPPGADVVAGICEPTMRNIVNMLMPRIMPALHVRRPGSPLADAEGLYPHALDGALQDTLDRALSGEAMCWRSPLDGTEQLGRDSLAVSEHRIGYRFRDRVTGTIFYVGAGSNVFTALDIFIPALQCVLAHVPDDSVNYGPPFAVAEEYLAHAAIHASLLVHYLRQPAHDSAVIMRGFPGMHLGHHIWNELTALDRLQRTVPRDALPMVFVPDADHGSEPFPPVEEILPAFAGRVDRTHAYRKESIGSLNYRRNLFLARSMDERVSSFLSERIRVASTARPLAQTAREEAGAFRADGYTIITLGMRVENRTSTDVVATTQAIIDRLAERIPKLVVVLDGQNARIGDDPSTCFGSYGQPHDRNPLLLEYDLILRMRHRYHYTPVKIVSTIGLSVPKSIAWCDASAAFIACWGAGLAKYRWVCNKPGLILSGKWNLSHRHDLRIYDLPEWQENPAPVTFIDANAVTDRPDLGVYFSIVSPVPITYSNFDIDAVALRNHIDLLVDKMLAQTVSGP